MKKTILPIGLGVLLAGGLAYGQSTGPDVACGPGWVPHEPYIRGTVNSASNVVRGEPKAVSDDISNTIRNIRPVSYVFLGNVDYSLLIFGQGSHPDMALTLEENDPTKLSEVLRLQALLARPNSNFLLYMRMPKTEPDFDLFKDGLHNGRYNFNSIEDVLCVNDKPFWPSPGETPPPK